MPDLNGFDASTVEPSADFDPIPAGKYEAVITESELKPTKAGTGEYLQLTFQIVEGDYNNRLLWSRLNLTNPNPTAVEIAKRDLSAICHAVGIMAPKDSTDLHNLPLVVHVRCKRREDTGEMTNEIKGFSAKEPPAAMATVGSDSTPPWTKS